MNQKLKNKIQEAQPNKVWKVFDGKTGKTKNQYPIRLDDTALVVKDKHYLIDNWKVGFLDDQDQKLIEWILENLK